MKKQINPTIKAHLIRGAFYLLLLLAVCAIPFALAQSRSRWTAKRSVATPNPRDQGCVARHGPSGFAGHCQRSSWEWQWADSASHVADSPGQ